MLRIREIHVRNYRSIWDERFVLPALTILVGKNDVGKSNLLEAIRVLLEGTATSIDSEDFYDIRRPIEITAVLERAREYLQLCDQKNRPKIEQRIDAGELLTIRRTAESPRKLGSIEIRDPQSGEFGTPTGIDAAIRPMIPEAIFIEALADVAEETKGTQKDALGKLVGQVVSSIAERVQPSLERAYQEANRLLNVLGAAPEGEGEVDERAEELRAVESEITGYLKETFPGASIRLKVRLPSIKEILGHIDVFVKEGTHEDPYYRRGHGLQRTLYLSLLRALAARIRQGRDQAVSRPFILLFEEPEAFLHPEGQIKMRNALEAIATKAQVIMATHSPIMVTPDSVPRTVRIEKRREEGLAKPLTRRFGPIDVAQLPVLQRQLLPLFAIQRSSRFLFSRGTLLVEGVGDEHIFSAIADRLRQFSLEANEIAIVETGGKGNLVPFAEILRKLGLEVWVLTDIDFLWDGAGTLLQGHVNYGQFVQRLNQLVPPQVGAARDDNTRRQEKLQRTQACITQLAAERDELCDMLIAHGIFVLREGEMEEYVGLGHTAKGQYIRAADEIHRGQRPVQNQQDFERVLDALQAWAPTPAD